MPVTYILYSDGGEWLDSCSLFLFYFHSDFFLSHVSPPPYPASPSLSFFFFQRGPVDDKKYIKRMGALQTTVWWLPEMPDANAVKQSFTVAPDFRGFFFFVFQTETIAFFARRRHAVVVQRNVHSKRARSAHLTAPCTRQDPSPAATTRGNIIWSTSRKKSASMTFVMHRNVALYVKILSADGQIREKYLRNITRDMWRWIISYYAKYPIVRRSSQYRL